VFSHGRERGVPPAAKKKQRPKLRHGQVGPAVAAHLSPDKPHKDRDNFQNLRRAAFRGTSCFS